MHASSLGGTQFNIDADVAAVLRPIIPILSQLQQRVQTSCYKWVFFGHAPGETWDKSCVRGWQSYASLGGVRRARGRMGSA